MSLIKEISSQMSLLGYGLIFAASDPCAGWPDPISSGGLTPAPLPRPPNHSYTMNHFDAAFSSSFVVAFLLGLFTSFHCLAMCGSIVGALTLSLNRSIRENKKLLFLFITSYNAGRITSYGLGGLIAGILETVLTMPLGDGGGHRALQIISALIMLGAGLHVAGWFPRFAYIEKAGAVIWRQLEPKAFRLIPIETLPKAFIFGMVWGWLPCGLVYTALAVAATSGDVFRSTLTMLAFGLGTMPAVMSIGVMTSLMVKVSSHGSFRQIAGCTLIFLALMGMAPNINPLVQHPMPHVSP